MKQFNQLICEASEKLSKDFEVGVNVLSKQTKDWLKGFRCRCRDLILVMIIVELQQKNSNWETLKGALRTIWGKHLEIDTNKSDNGTSVTKTYIAGDYAGFY